MTSSPSDDPRFLHAELERLRGLLRQAGLEPDAPSSSPHALTDSRYRQILESAVDFAVIALDRQGLITHWNEGARRILGWSLEELRGKPADLFFTPEDRALGLPEREMRTALETGRAIDERWHLRRDGSRFWASGEMTPLKDDTGTPVGFVKILRDRTAHRRLDEERERFHLLFEQTPDFVGIANAEGQGLFINRAGRRMVGLADDEVVRMSIPDFFPPEERDLIRDVSLPAQRSEGHWRAELHFQHLRTGEHIPVDYNAFTLRDAAGRLTGYATVTRDISERKRAEQRLRDSEQDLRLITDQAPEMIGYLDPQLRYLWVNQTYTEWFQRPREHIVGLTVLELVGPEAYAVREPYFRRALAGERVGFETFLTTEGKRRDIDLRLFPRLDAEGRVQGVFTFILDITERKRIERGLREANEQLEQRVEERTRERDRIWKNSDELLCVAGFDGYLRSFNPAFCRLVGLDEQTLLSTPFLDITHPDDHAGVLEALAQLGRGERLIRFEDRVRRVDGTYRTVSWTAVPDEGFFFVVGRDITWQQQQEQALREVEDRLRQSQKMEAVGQLTGGIAHDFNNLLGGIMGSMEMLRRRLDTGRYAETGKYIDATMNSAKRAAALTSRLLAFGRRQSLDVKSTEVNSLVRSMEELLRRTLGEHVSLKVLLEPAVWPAYTDAHQFENALLNLAINARDAMPDGGLLTVETTNTRLDESYTRGFEELKPGQYVVLSVSDTGQGMTPEVMARAFEPFFTTKPIGQGTGLGLSMIYGFARQVGGHVRIYSEVGRGTSVKLFMPRFLGAEALAGQAPPVGEAPRAQRGETVLVVEDEPAVRLLVMEILEDLGYTAIEAQDARSALPTLDGHGRVDLLVTDVGLPGGTNGRQLAEMARQRRPGLKVLFITGYAEGASVRSGFLEPGMEMLTKPFALDVLASRIREMIERK